MLLGDPRQSDQRTQSFHFPIVVHQSLDPAAQSSAKAPSSLSFNTCTSKFERSTGSECVDALGLRAVEVIICMITRDFSVISMTSQASLSLSLPLTKVTDAQYRKRFRASYNTMYKKVFPLPTTEDLKLRQHFFGFASKKKLTSFLYSQLLLKRTLPHLHSVLNQHLCSSLAS